MTVLILIKKLIMIFEVPPQLLHLDFLCVSHHFYACYWSMRIGHIAGVVIALNQLSSFNFAKNKK